MRRVLAAVLFLVAMTLIGVVLLALLAPFVSDEIAVSGAIFPWVLVLVITGPLFLVLARLAANLWWASVPRPLWHRPSVRALGAMYGSGAGLALLLSFEHGDFTMTAGLAIAAGAVLGASFVGPRH